MSNWKKLASNAIINFDAVESIVLCEEIEILKKPFVEFTLKSGISVKIKHDTQEETIDYFEKVRKFLCSGDIE